MKQIFKEIIRENIENIIYLKSKEISDKIIDNFFTRFTLLERYVGI